MNSKVKFWEPLWSTTKPKPMDQDEMFTLEFVAAATNVPKDDIEPVLDIKNRKVLRIRLFKANEYSRDLYDYLFFGPVNFNGKNIFLAETIPAELTGNGQSRTTVINTDQIIAKIKREVSITKAAQERLKKKEVS